MLNLQQGKKLVILARQTINSFTSKKKTIISPDIKKEFSEERGVFVTLEKKGILRGCIGIVDAVKPLYRAVVDSSVSAASADPRFPPIDKKEAEEVSISVSVLTRPQAIYVRNPGDYLKKIQIGKDGLIVKGIFNSGLLLPIVAVEQKWDAKTFLEQTCIKAGLPPDTWNEFDNCRVYRFQTQVFSEISPRGEIIQKM